MTGDTDLTRFRGRVEELPARVTARLRAVAESTSHRIQARAKQLLLAQSNAKATADAIVVIEEAAKKRFVVDSPNASADPVNNPLWLERGTVRQRARPYMRPAADEAREQYKVESKAAAVQEVTDVLQP